MDEHGVRAIAAESAALQQRFFSDNAPLLVEVGRRMAESLRSGGKVLAFGNGGSASDAQHFVAELVGRFTVERAAYAALALTTDPSVMTAVGNDYGFDAVFRRQVEAHGKPGDVALGTAPAGRPPTGTGGRRAARDRGLLTVGRSGGGGGRMDGLVHYLIDVPHHATPRVQEVHAVVVHVLCQV